MSLRLPNTRELLLDILFVGQLGFAAWVYVRRSPGQLSAAIVTSIVAGAALTMLLCLGARRHRLSIRLLLGALAGQIGGIATYFVSAELASKDPFLLAPGIGHLQVMSAVALFSLVTWSWFGGAILAIRVGLPTNAPLESKAKAAQQDVAV